MIWALSYSISSQFVTSQQLARWLLSWMSKRKRPISMWKWLWWWIQNAKELCITLQKISLTLDFLPLWIIFHMNIQTQWNAFSLSPINCDKYYWCSKFGNSFSNRIIHMIILLSKYFFHSSHIWIVPYLWSNITKFCNN